ncbi:MAG: EpsG family protein, partial [Gammaproteobacteria bacterium]|nr:EpsG family protein [Gammaproteobacteria bacterium]
MLPIMLFIAIAVFMIGLRFQVGGDWVNYLRQFYILQYLSLEEVVTTSDAGYAALNWLMDQLGWGIYGVNFASGAIFMAGLSVFALRMSNPWMAILVSIPYLLVVVAMGYTRQSVALGFEFCALTALARSKYGQFYIYIICGTLFHKTAIVLSLLGIFSGRNRFSLLRISLGLIIVYLSFNAFLADYYESYVEHYIRAEMESSGALIRVLMNVLPATIFLLLYRKWSKQLTIDSHWLLFALASLACIPMLGVTSTAVDRMALYLAPLQLYVWSHLPLI